MRGGVRTAARPVRALARPAPLSRARFQVQCDCVRVKGDRECLEANVEYGNRSGYIVRLDVEMPAQAVNGRSEDGGAGWPPAAVRHQEAEDLAHQLLTVASRVRDLRTESPS